MGLLFLLLPPAEVILGIELGKAFGGWWVLAGLAAGVVLGSTLIRLCGAAFFRQAMADLQRQQVPTEALLGGIAWWVAGALLIFPGFISDVLALLVLLPPVRRRVLARFRRIAEERMVKMQGGAAFQWTPQGGWQGQQGPAGQGGDVYEGEGREIVEDAPALPPTKEQR
ncbi:MAG: FxsA family protein [Moraxellaceae bacterium]